MMRSPAQKYFPRGFHWSAHALLLLALAMPVVAEVKEDFKNLLNNSPFEPEKKPVPPPPAKPRANLRVWGYVVDQGKYSFNLNDALSGRTAWVSPGQSAGPFRIQDYNLITGQLAVEFDGAVYRLQVKPRATEPAGPNVAQRN